MIFKLLNFLILIFIIIVISKPLHASEIVNLNNLNNQYILDSNIEILEDKNNKWSIKDVRSAGISELFHQNKRINFGYTNSIYWVRFTVKNTSEKKNYLLEVANPLTDSITLYIPNAVGIYERKTGGDSLPFKEREVKYRKTVFKFSLKTNETKQLYVRFQTWSTMELSLILWSQDGFTDNVIQGQYGLGIYYGIIIVMIFYNLFLFLSLKDIGYLYYVLYIMSIGISHTIFNGLAHEYFWPSYPDWNNQSTSFFVGLTSFWAIQFTRSYLMIKKITPKFDILLKIFMGLNCILMLISLFSYTPFTYKLTSTLALFSVIVILLGAFLSLRKKYKPAWFFLIAWFSLIFGILIFLMRSFGILPNIFITVYGMQIGSALEVILLSLGLGYKINIIRQEKEKMQTELVNIQEIAITNLNKIDKLKDEFLANTSHELRTPLNGIIGIAESLIDGVTGELPKKTISNLSMIVLSGRRLFHLVNDILDFSKLKNNEINLELKPVDLYTITKIVLKLSEPLINTKHLKLVNLIEPDFPSVLADENRLQQIIHNIISNAIKFTDTGKIEISAKISSIGQNGKPKFIEITISDTGIGIPEDKHNVIFDSFQQIDASVSRSYGGAGLGLAISKKLINLHGGNIWVDSKLNEGSNFTFTLPISLEKANGKSELQLYKLKTVTEFQETDESFNIVENFNNNIFKILVVDDDPVNLQVISNHLSFLNYNIILAQNGEIALNIIGKQKIELVLLDVMMPKMSGYEVCQKIRKSYNLSELPIILLTAKDKVLDLVEGFNSGANDYIIKPFSKPELLSRINLHLNLMRSNYELRNLNENLESLVIKRTAELSESEERYRILVELCPYGIGVFIDNKLIFINPAGAKLLGANNPQQLIDTPIIKFIHSDSHSRLVNGLDEIKGLPNKIHLIEEKFINLNGKVIDVEVASTTFNYKNKLASLIIYRDITERKRVERLRADTERIVHHDLKNPLSSILGFSDVLLAKIPKANTEHEWVSHIYNCGKQMLHMINHSLDIFKMEEGTYFFSPISINLINLFHKINEDFNNYQEMNSVKIVYKLNEEEIKWEENYEIYGVEGHLNSMFANLLKNAIEASPKNSEITVSIKEKNDFHYIDIHNFGVIPESIRDRLFERYTTSGKRGGTGIGAYSAMLIAKTHKGNISFTTSKKEGTNLIVKLPKTYSEN
ncbi:MAG: ATP-binding protein [Spirochaetota bacterium]|nr:ATP-binding protein [Spirochaetota bacterium]